MYVVIGVLLIILLGLFVYLVSMDIKLRRLEKKSREMEAEQQNVLSGNKKE
jgi:predicted Holliday junction resolvase-like endonuclease